MFSLAISVEPGDLGQIGHFLLPILVAGHYIGPLQGAARQDRFLQYENSQCLHWLIRCCAIFDASAGVHPLTAPSVAPSMIQRLKNTNMSTDGTIAIITPANSVTQSDVYCII